MREPALNLLIGKAENKYSLVLAAAKRAREIIAGDEPLVKITIDNPLTIATNEIAKDMVHCTFPDKNDELSLEEADLEAAESESVIQ